MLATLVLFANARLLVLLPPIRHFALAVPGRDTFREKSSKSKQLTLFTLTGHDQTLPNMGAFSDETAAFLTQLNQTASYIGKFALAVYFLIPAIQGDFAAFKRRLIQTVPLVGLSYAVQSEELLGFGCERLWVWILESQVVDDLAQRVSGKNVDLEVTTAVIESVKTWMVWYGVVWICVAIWRRRNIQV
jgi:hypothetical protein